MKWIDTAIQGFYDLLNGRQPQHLEPVPPTLDSKGQKTLTYKRPVEPRRPVKERLGKGVDVTRIRNTETDPELEYLRAQID